MLVYLPNRAEAFGIFGLPRERPMLNGQAPVPVGCNIIGM
jgi:hypothetical protein